MVVLACGIQNMIQLGPFLVVDAQLKLEPNAVLHFGTAHIVLVFTYIQRLTH